MDKSYSEIGVQPGIQMQQNGSFLRKFAFMTMVVVVVYGLLSVAGFYLWFVFPVEKIHGLTYLRQNDLILYYIIINFNDIAGVLLFSHIIYYKYVKSTSPVKDGFFLGIYLVIFSWILDLFVYVFIRKTLPTLEEYLLGKNQPEIGIAWLIAFLSALYSGWLHAEDENHIRRFNYKKAILVLLILTIISSALTVAGILFFDVRP
ncbi:MAG: hypothetical protein U0W24_26430 [Bacteroidales bacterium]